ncbi:Hpt domain-containing protein [Xanthomonas sp. XNM01]|uniref:Hpt domain-containing protein n=1 Tax=Xanthomonas sp. XNM01 TaxID=2769289 RepID=UPI0017853DF0|nr:Hpt domain-containing protein [Xanthomonas sp. XNM01]MBD9367391.1 Hpt domain-containing protein [Xanthomonas sp. XNM01]
MNALRDAMSHAVLGWVKPELDETLRQARTEVEAFVDYPADTSRMRFCAGYLHQVQGTLRMVELYAPAMVAEEMELLAQALQEGAVTDRDEACATLMRGTVLLPDYLERLQNGHRDIPIVLLPLLNEIRAARGAAGLSESVLFAPDLSRPLPEQVAEASALPAPQRLDRAADALETFESALLSWPAGGAPEQPEALASAADALLEHAEQESTRRMLWVLSSVATALRDGALEADERLHAAFAGIARAMHQIRDAGSGAAQGVASQEPTRQLLYLVAQSSARHPAIDALRQAFELDAHAPSQAEIDHARGSLAGRNRSLLDTVGGVVKEELLRVKDALDLHLRMGGDAAALQPQAAELSKVADTLGMLGLGVARDVVLQQRDTLDAIAQGQQPASESALLDIAGALLYVDASLDDQVARLGAPEQDGAEDTAAVEARRTIEVLAHEAIANFAAAREQFVAFIETNWDHARLHDVPRLLDEVAGALRILDLPQPAEYLAAVRRYVATELIGRLRVPSGRQLDTLADAMASLEYYLEALRDRRPNRDEILEIAHSSLEALGYWPPVDESAVADVAPVEPAFAAQPSASGLDAAVAPVVSAAAPGMPTDSAFIAPSEHLTVSAEPPAFGWDTVEIETPQTFASVEEDDSWTLQPVALDGPEREPIALPALDIELAPVTPVTPAIPAVVDTLHYTFDPVDAEQSGPTIETTATWDPPAFDPVAAEYDAEPATPVAGWPDTIAPVALESGLEPTPALEQDAPAFGSIPPEEAVASAAPSLDSDPGIAASVDVDDVAGTVQPAPKPFEAASSGQWLDLTIRMQPASRPARVFESHDSHVEVDADSSSLVASIAPAADVLPEAGFESAAAVDDDAGSDATIESVDPTLLPPARADAQAPAHTEDAEDADAGALLAEIDSAASQLPVSGTVESVQVPGFDQSVEAVQPAHPVAGGFDQSGEMDAEIREVFLEEFDEELANLARLMPAWRALPNDMERLRPIRRVFHTLKGSGRLVGARALGEFSWKIESMLNRVLDGTRPASPAVLDLVQKACDVLPQFNAALRGQDALVADIAALEAVADRVAAGEDVFADAPADAPAASPDEPAATLDATAASAPAADDAGTAASVDSVLREILEAEVAAHLETVDAWVAEAGEAPILVSDALLRAMHTMNGAFAMTDVPEITLVTDPAETYIKRSLATAQAPAADGVAALGDTAEAIRACIAALREPAPRIARRPELVARLHALAATLPDVRWPRDLHEEDIDLLDGGDEVLHAADDLSAYLSVDALAAAPGGLSIPAGALDAPQPAGDTVPLSTGDAWHRDEDRTDTDTDTDTDTGEAMQDRPDDAVQADATEPSSPFAMSDEADATAVDGWSADLDDAWQERAVEAEVYSPAWDLDPAPTNEARLADAVTTPEQDEPALQDAEADPAPTLEPAPADAEPTVGSDWAAELDGTPETVGAAPDMPVDAWRQEPQSADAQADDAPLAPLDAVEPAQASDDAGLSLAAPDQDVAATSPASDWGSELDAAPAAPPAVDVVDLETDDAAVGEPVDAVPADAATGVDSVLHDDVALPPVADDADALDLEVAEATADLSEPVAESDGVFEWNDDLDDAPGAEPESPSAAATADTIDDIAIDDAALQVSAASAQAQGDDAQEHVAAQDASTPPVADGAVEATVPSPVVAAPVRDTADQMLDFSELDRELVDIFVEEGGDLLDHIDHQLHALREDPAAREPVVELQRDLHTLKGGARMAGIATLGDLGHVIESLLEAIAGNRTELQRDDIVLLERGFDTLHELLVKTRAHRTTEMPAALIAAFEARIRGESPTLDLAASAAAPDGVPVPATDTVETASPVATQPPVAATIESPASAPAPAVVETAISTLAPLSAPIEDDLAQVAHDEAASRSPQEQVRVRADLLDNLVNHAGEVAIYRSRLEQQLGAFRSAMGELDRTNARLRDQLRRLDLETEAQIVARYQREQDSAEAAFDPLELDRFSTLQQLSRALNESAADLTGLQGVLDDLSRQYDVLLQQQSRVSSDLQDGLMSARMVPFDSIVPRLRRVVRQAGHDTGKQVQLKLDGTHGELDRNVLDRMAAPLEHMLRNSVAHGLELADERRANGKDEEGTITIALRHEGSEIVLQVADDGRGLDRAAIRRRAEQRGLVRADAVLTDAELDSVIFESGFSTSEQVSQLAGRGVGMDVVRNEVRQLGGSVEIASMPGRGAVFTLRLPQTLAVTQAVFVQIGETTYAVPVASVSGIGRIARERFDSRSGGYRYAGEEYALHDLGVLVGQASAKAEGQEQMPLLLVRAGDLRAAVAIDQVLGNREIVVKPVGLQISSVPGIYGATITGDGRVIVILDVAPLVRRHLAQPARPVVESAPSPQRHVPLVMVVDDSLTMRKVTGRVLERHNFEVVVARDGVEALEKLEERVPDLMLLDIEMPRMDGYELATAMRADDRYRGVPIVMITSRTGEKHRQRAFEIGVQRYLGKPYQELDLMRNVYDLLGIARVRE